MPGVTQTTGEFDKPHPYQQQFTMPYTWWFTRRHVELFLGDPVVFDRALNYYRRGLVTEVYIEPGRLFGMVRGSGRSPYRVLVETVAGRLQAVCTCPYPFRCKHVGALLLAAVDQDKIPHEWETVDLRDPEPWDEDDDLDDEEWDEFDDEEWEGSSRGPLSHLKPTTTRRKEPPPLGTRDLSADQAHRPELGLVTIRSSEYRAEAVEPGTEQQPGKHVLELHILGEQTYLRRVAVSVSATPMMRYIRKDGAFGALKKWRPKAECITENPKEVDLLPAFDSQEGRKIPFARLLPMLVLDKPAPRLWVSPPPATPSRRLTESDGCMPVRLSRIKTVEATFFPVRYTHGGVLFCPSLAVIDDSGEHYPLQSHLDARFAQRLNEGRSHFLVEEQIDMLRPFLGTGRFRNVENSWYWISCDTGTSLIVDRVRAYVFWSQSPVLEQLLAHLNPEDLPEFSYADIEGLKDRFPGDDTSEVRVVLPASTAEIREATCKAVVEVDEGAVTFFRDIERPAEGDHPATDADGAPANRTLVLDFYDNNRADEVVQEVAGLCFTLLSPFEPKQVTPNGFLCDGSIQDIVDLLAGPMLDVGAYLRVRGRPVRSGELSFALRVVSTGEDWFGLRLSAEVDGDEAEIADGAKVAFTKDGQAVIIRNRDDLDRLMRKLGITMRSTIRVQEGDFHQLAELDGLITGADGDEGEPRLRRVRDLIRRATKRRDAWLRLADKMEGLDQEEPPGFGTALRPYQRYGFAWLEAAGEEGFGPLLADDMGLGKTVQALALLHKRNGRAPGLSLVVAPPTTLENWRHETLAFAPGLEPVVYHGRERAKLLAEALHAVNGGGARRARAAIPASAQNAQPCVLITSYQTLLKDADALGQVSWDHLIFDEVQTIKNAKTKTYRAARGLKSTYRLALSGTPVENTSLELYAVIDLLNPGLLGNRASFFRRLAGPIERDGDPEARRRLRELLTPIVLRRRKADVAKDLPARDEIPMYVALPTFQRNVYDSIRLYYQEKVREALADPNPTRRIFVILEGLTRLRQAAVDPALLPLEQDAQAGKRAHAGGAGAHAGARAGKETAAKLAALDELVPGVINEGHRVLIFSQFVSLLEILRRWADGRGIPYCYLDGSMTPAVRRAEIMRFQEDDGPPVFFISLRAGGVGVNLTAADYVILMDPWWNPAVEDQAIDRTHRIGQTRPVTAYRLIASDTVEEQIAALQERKKALARDIVPNESSLISSLSPEQILELFSP